MDARVMRFTINRASVVNSEKIPIEMMNEQMQVFSAKRIVPSNYFEYTKPVGLKLKQRFMDLVRTRASGAMMVEGEEKYLIKSTRTLNATIIAMDTLGWNYTFANQRGETVWTCDQATVCVNMDTMEKQPIPDDLRPGLRHHLEGASS